MPAVFVENPSKQLFRNALASVTFNSGPIQKSSKSSGLHGGGDGIRDEKRRELLSSERPVGAKNRVNQKKKEQKLQPASGEKNKTKLFWILSSEANY